MGLMTREIELVLPDKIEECVTLKNGDWPIGNILERDCGSCRRENRFNNSVQNWPWSYTEGPLKDRGLSNNTLVLKIGNDIV